MNALNRGVAIVLGLALVAASGTAGAALAFPHLRSDIAQRSVLAAGVLELLPARGWQRWTAALLALAIVLLGLVLLLLEIRPDRRDERLLLSDDGDGDVTVLVESVRRLAEHAAGQVPRVREVRSRVVRTSRGLRVRCRVAIDPAASVPELAREVQARVAATVEHHLGRPVAGISVLAQITPITSSRRRVR
jgi:hypothetical protein